MLKRGKLKFVPSVTRPPKQVEAVAAHPNTVAYYPGCSLHSTAREYDRSIRRVMESVDLELVEPPGWVCCGSSPAHTSDPKRATLLPVQNLQTVERMGLDAVTAPCSACFARMKTAAHTVAHNPEMAREVERETGYSYDGSVKVKSLVETLLERAGPEKVAAQVKKKLTGLKVACYYGCLMTRPPQILEAEHPEYPTQIEELVAPLGAETVDWSYKTDCCGGTLGLTQTDIALEMTAKILRNARDCGADIVVTACPLCHVNLDARQSQMGLDFQMPVLYLTQLMALAFGYEEKETGLKKNFVRTLRRLWLERAGRHSWMSACVQCGKPHKKEQFLREDAILASTPGSARARHSKKPQIGFQRFDRRDPLCLAFDEKQY